MASGHPLIMRQRAFAAKLETVAGTAVSLAAADGALICFDPKITYDIPMNKRASPGSMSSLTGVPGARKAKVTLTTELAGKGSSGLPLWATTLLAAAGFAASSQTYAPVSGSATADCLTCGTYIDGRLWQAAGVMFSFIMKCKAGDPVLIEWEGEGVYVVPTDVALIAPTYPTVLPPRFAGGTLTFGGVSRTLDEMEIAVKNTLYVRKDAAHVSGYRACCIPTREITVTIDPEALALSTLDNYAQHLASTEVALSAIIGSGANSIVTISAPKLQLMNVPDPTDRDGVLAEKLVYMANKSASAGDDELTIAFS